MVKGTQAAPGHIAWVMMAHMMVMLVWYCKATGEAQDTARRQQHRIRTLGVWDA